MFHVCAFLQIKQSFVHNLRKMQTLIPLIPKVIFSSVRERRMLSQGFSVHSGTLDNIRILFSPIICIEFKREEWKPWYECDCSYAGKLPTSQHHPNCRLWLISCPQGSSLLYSPLFWTQQPKEIYFQHQ